MSARGPAVSEVDVFREILRSFWVSVLLCGSALAGAGALSPAVAQSALERGAAPIPRVKPPAPPPSQYVDREDFERLKRLADYAQDRNFSRAYATARSVEDDTARSLAQWMYLFRQPPRGDYRDGFDFLDLHPDWPMRTTIQRWAERRMPNDLATEEILKRFDSRDPVTGEGKILLARALKRTGHDEVATTWVRDAWINHDWIESKERRILNEFGKWLRPEDHAWRVDRLLWSNQRTATRRLLSRLDSDARQLTETRLLFMSRDRNAMSAYESLPPHLQTDSAILFQIAKYMRDRDRDDDARAYLLAGSNRHADLRNPDLWWQERRIQSRRALKEGHFQDAYALAAAHGYTTGRNFLEGEFLAGWIALRFLGDPRRAAMHFDELSRGVRYPGSRSRAHYWAGRAAAANGSVSNALMHYRLAASFPTTYHGQLAAEHLEPEELPVTLPLQPDPTIDDAIQFEARPLVHAASLLGEMGERYWFRIFMRHLDDQIVEPGEFVLLARKGIQYGIPDASVRAAKVSALTSAELPELSFPLLYVPDDVAQFAEPALILGLSRQESEFNPRAISPAGARGLMQLMPDTARITANKERMPYRRSALLDDPGYNMTVGAAHLSHLLDRFDGSYVMTLAGYNAGARRPERWARDYGDPRDPNVDPVDWVELIPFTETRNYVQSVLANIQVYRARMNGQQLEWRLSDDLTRGGPTGRAGRLTPPSPVLAEKGIGDTLTASAQPSPAAQNLLRIANALRRGPRLKPPVPSFEAPQAEPQLAANEEAEAPAPLTALTESVRDVLDTASEVEVAEDARDDETELAETDNAESNAYEESPSATVAAEVPSPPESSEAPAEEAVAEAAEPAPSAPVQSPIFRGAIETEDCAVFLPDDTGGGTCIVPKGTDEHTSEELAAIPSEAEESTGSIGDGDCAPTSADDLNARIMDAMQSGGDATAARADC